jgi:hypothetical protein
MKSTLTYIILLFVLFIVIIFYKRFQEKLDRENTSFNNNAIQQFLLDDVTLAKSKKPILWIYVPYEYNSRNWLSFGSRSSFELNQPYLYLTVRSIIQNCSDSFTICIIDDNAFQKLIPNWSIEMRKIASPISNNIRTLGFMKLLYIYGGIHCPISFLCMRDLIELYERGTQRSKMFICETINRNITSSTYDFYPNLEFCGSPKECETVNKLISFIQRTISFDSTAESVFNGEFNRWCESLVRSGEINLIGGAEIGTKTVDDEQVLTEDLLSQSSVKLYDNMYGILIYSKDILNRKSFEWFARMSAKQVLRSHTLIGNYMVMANTRDSPKGVLEAYKPDDKEWVGFWKTPLVDIYGVKQPNYLGNNIEKVAYPRQ